MLAIQSARAAGFHHFAEALAELLRRELAMKSNPFSR
jgi:hypothetical protein